MIKIIEADGWYHVATRGSHRQYKHASKKGRVTIPGKLSDDVPPGLLSSKMYHLGFFQASGNKEAIAMRYLIIIEKAEHNYGAYCPDLPGCVSTGKTIEETKKNMQEAIEFHLDGMREDGEPIPQPSTTDAWLDISVA